MCTRRFIGFRGALPALVAGTVLLGAAAPSAQAITFVYVCLCCRPDGSVRYAAGWINGDCDSLAAIPIVVGCDNLFTAFAVPPSGGIGNGYATAFDRAVTLGPVIPAGPGNPETRLVMGYYPAADTYTPGSYSTRIFAIQQGGSGTPTPNRYAPIDIALTGLSTAADSIITTSVLGGEPITGPFDNTPGPLVGSGDVTIVVQTYKAADTSRAVDTRLIPVTLSSLTFVDATPLPPACFGDANRSGTVSFGDVTSVLANFNHTYPVGVLTPGDANGDRVVNFGDVTMVLANFGAVCM